MIDRTLPALHADTLDSVIERKRMLDAAWAVCLVALLATVAIPWWLNVLDVDLGAVAVFVVVTATAYLVAGSYTDRLTSRSAVLAAMRTMPLVSVVLIGVFWHLAGGLANPFFLVAFVFPVILTGIMVSGWTAHCAATLSIVVASAFALAESPDLRWFVANRRDWLLAAFNYLPDLSGRVLRVHELRPSPAYHFAILVTFALTQGVVAFLTTPLALLVVRLDSRLRVSHRMLHEVQGLFHAILCAEPHPGIILYADTLQPVQASDSFFQRMLLRPEAIVGKTLFQIVRFDNPVRLRQAFEAQSGEIEFCVYRVGDETRIAHITFHRTDHGGTGYLYVAWRELTETYFLRAAFDALEGPLFVISAVNRLQYMNRSALELFGPMHFGMAVDAVANLDEIVREARRHGPSTQDLRVTIAERPYTAQSLTASLPEQSGVCTILWLRCVEREETLFEQATRDPLTGIHNRRYFDGALAGHLERRKRGHAVALATFDLDNFKYVNDRWGHAAGDAALIGFVRLMRAQLRESDVFARRGGDEFSVLFSDATSEVGAAAIARVHAALAGEGITFDGERLPLGVSVGLIEFRATDTVAALLERADRAVYAAKREGKGRCVVER